MVDVTYRSDETDPDFVVIVWEGAEGAPPTENGAGISHPHTTRVISGRIRLTYEDDPRNPIELGAGEEIVIAINRPYVVEAIGRGRHEVRCFYPRANASAVAEIQHLRRAQATVYARE